MHFKGIAVTYWYLKFCMQAGYPGTSLLAAQARLDPQGLSTLSSYQIKFWVFQGYPPYVAGFYV